ncbi:MAG: hypothetical protein AAF799_40720 [Myxococcota bacterium]
MPSSRRSAKDPDRPARRRATCRRETGALAALLALAACTAEALPREDAPRPTLQLAAVEPDAEPPTDSAARGGYWLGIDLVGPAAAQQAATLEVSEGLTLLDPADQTPPGILVGHVEEVQEAIRWVDRHAFDPRVPLPNQPRALQPTAAPTPGGGLLRRHDATLVAFVISGATPDLLPRTIAWPLDQSAILPPGSTWQPAALIPVHAPLFAAPSPSVPPAAEAHAIAHRRGGLFVLNWFDRCEPGPNGDRCLRWAQVMVRDGDRFSPGYLPMFQVASRGTWVRGSEPLPRAQLIPIAIEGGRARWLLLARGRDNQLHRRTLEAPAEAEGWPRSSLRIHDETAAVILGDEPTQQWRLDASLDARGSGTPVPDEAAASGTGEPGVVDRVADP